MRIPVVAYTTLLSSILPLFCAGLTIPGHRKGGTTAGQPVAARAIETPTTDLHVTASYFRTLPTSALENEDPLHTLTDQSGPSSTFNNHRTTVTLSLNVFNRLGKTVITPSLSASSSTTATLHEPHGYGFGQNKERSAAAAAKLAAWTTIPATSTTPTPPQVTAAKRWRTAIAEGDGNFWGSFSSSIPITSFTSTCFTTIIRHDGVVTGCFTWPSDRDMSQVMSSDIFLDNIGAGLASILGRDPPRTVTSSDIEVGPGGLIPDNSSDSATATTQPTSSFPAPQPYKYRDAPKHFTIATKTKDTIRLPTISKVSSFPSPHRPTYCWELRNMDGQPAWIWNCPAEPHGKRCWEEKHLDGKPVWIWKCPGSPFDIYRP